MTARFAAPLYPGGRMCLLSGSVTVGAVFPPAQAGGLWRWVVWVTPVAFAGNGEARTEQAAKNAALAHWRDFLAAAGLQEVKT